MDSNEILVNLNFYRMIDNFYMHPILYVVLIIIVILVILSSLGSSNNNIDENGNSNRSWNFFSIIGFILFLVLAFLFLKLIQYLFGLNFLASFQEWLWGKNILDIQGRLEKPVVPEIKLKKQVFNIPENKYGYYDAKSLCSAYGAKLATYSELEEAYNKGAEWCNYGWSEGQMALFPTQQKSFDHLQTIKGHEHDCGRPGINGGYNANPLVKYGVNCYGYKPHITQEEAELLKSDVHYPKTLKDIAMEQRVDYWKQKISEILVSPFNYDVWSRL